METRKSNLDKLEAAADRSHLQGQRAWRLFSGDGSVCSLEGRHEASGVFCEGEREGGLQFLGSGVCRGGMATLGVV